MNLELANHHTDPEDGQADAREVQPHGQGTADGPAVQAQGVEKTTAMHPAETVERAVRLLLEVWRRLDVSIEATNAVGVERVWEDRHQLGCLSCWIVP